MRTRNKDYIDIEKLRRAARKRGRNKRRGGFGFIIGAIIIAGIILGIYGNLNDIKRYLRIRSM